MIDLSVEQGIVAIDRGNEHIAVEVKSFPGPSLVNDLRHAFGPYTPASFGAATGAH